MWSRRPRRCKAIFDSQYRVVLRVTGAYCSGALKFSDQHFEHQRSSDGTYGPEGLRVKLDVQFAKVAGNVGAGFNSSLM